MYRPSIQLEHDYNTWEYEYRCTILYSTALSKTTLGQFYQRIVETIKCRNADINSILPLIPELLPHICTNKYE
jgi:hypothetical protein